jgi:hypothetical protein
MKKNSIKASKFIQWYLEMDMEKDYIYNLALNQLEGRGTIHISAYDLFKDSQSIPSDICEKLVEEYTEYDPEELTFINDKKQ